MAYVTQMWCHMLHTSSKQTIKRLPENVSTIYCSMLLQQSRYYNHFHNKTTVLLVLDLWFSVFVVQSCCEHIMLCEININIDIHVFLQTTLQQLILKVTDNFATVDLDNMKSNLLFTTIAWTISNNNIFTWFTAVVIFNLEWAHLSCTPCSLYVNQCIISKLSDV